MPEVHGTLTDCQVEFEIVKTYKIWTTVQSDNSAENMALMIQETLEDVQQSDEDFENYLVSKTVQITSVK